MAGAVSSVPSSLFAPRSSLRCSRSSSQELMKSEKISAG
jgi:hypothetical protein